GNLAETIGGLLAPAITVLADGLASVVGFLQENAAPAFKVLVTWLSNTWDAIKPVAEALGRDLLEAATQTWHVIQANLVPALMRFWEAVKPVVIAIGAAVVIILKLALEALPVVINAISLVIDWLALQIKAFRAVVEFVKDHFVEPIVDAISRIVDFIRRVVEVVKGPLVDAWQFVLGPIKAVIDRVIGWIQDIIDAVQTAIEWLSKLNPISETRGVSQETGLGQFRPPPGLQQGGFIARTGLAVVHAGETVIPRDGGGIVVNLYGPVMGADVGRVVRDELLKLGKRNAGTGL
ncbi:MAG: hypothetical protein ACRDIC_08295, partial [bacterium]